MSFFVNTPEAERLAKRMGADYLGPDPSLSRQYNNKVFQRILMANMNGNIFPRNRILHSEGQAERAYSDIHGHGREVVGKVGYLASGEGMEVLGSKDQAREFYRKWEENICSDEGHPSIPSHLFLEEKKPLRNGINSVSVQFLLNKGMIHYIGPSVQMVKGEFIHAGNRTGSDLSTYLEFWVEKEMLKKSAFFMSMGMGDLSHLSHSIIGFDFIVTREEEVLMVECNFRCTASTLLFGLESQLGSHLSYELTKFTFPRPLKYDFQQLVEKLAGMNSSERIIIPLDPRLFDQRGEMFLAVATPTFHRIEETKKELYELTGDHAP